MRTLFVLRPDAARHPGGDVVHAERAAAALRGRGATVDIVTTADPDARGYDVAHVFGIFEPETAAQQIAAVERVGVPLALSPIWLDLRTYLALAPRVERALRAHHVAGTERRLARVRRERRTLPWHGRAARAADERLDRQRALAARAHVLLPASETEAHYLGERLGVRDVPYVVAPLGTEPIAPLAPTARSGVVCFARIESKKNQAALLYALRDVDVDVTIVGRAYDEPYTALCRRHATARTTFREHVPHEEVFAMLARAAVHAHPSWLESPGLSSLEAAAAGARVVCGDLGCEREYFGATVDYADPGDPASIRAAVLRALARPPRRPGDELDRRLADFTWERHAEATLAAYRMIAR